MERNFVVMERGLSGPVFACHRKSIGGTHHTVRLPLLDTVRAGMRQLSPRERRELWAEFARLDGMDEV